MHTLTLTDLYRLAVDHHRFCLSKNREEIMGRLWVLCACLCRWGVGEELWIDGSFLTEKIDPEDIDLVMILPERFEEQAAENQLGVWDWLDEDEPEELFGCHVFIVPRVPQGEPEHKFAVREAEHWKRFFGRSRQGQAKGIVRILLPEGCR